MGQIDEAGTLSKMAVGRSAVKPKSGAFGTDYEFSLDDTKVQVALVAVVLMILGLAYMVYYYRQDRNRGRSSCY